MPLRNQFQHQLYPTQPQITPRLLTLTHDQYSVEDLRDLHARTGVVKVLLVHGTFVGDDPFGIVEMLNTVSRALPAGSQFLDQLADEVRERTRPLTSGTLKDIANYFDGFRDQFQELVGNDPQVELPAHLWSSQNHHLARAELAVNLIARLLSINPASDERVLFWGHSHAGNAFALMSNLLANDKQWVRSFFAAMSSECNDVCRAVREHLLSSPSPHPLAQSVDFVAFGTPVRYGWDRAGYRTLTHVLHHRNPDPASPFRTKPLFPPHLLNDVLSATYGDWVQAFAIAGTDTTSLPAAEQNNALTTLLQRNLPAPQHGLDTRFLFPQIVRDACAWWKTGTRCHTDGVNLLVNYIPSGSRTVIGQPIEGALLGHGVATTQVWLPAHLHLIMQHL